jgi:hypothetical protein
MRRSIQFWIIIVLCLLGVSRASAQFTEPSSNAGSSVAINFGDPDTAFAKRLWSSMQQPGLLHSMLLDHFTEMNELSIDTGKDSTIFELSTKAFGKHKHKKHIFLVTEIEDPRQITHLEPFSMIDFNRVDGFFLGLGSSGMFDFGPHDEFGVNAGGGYGFANKRWQAFAGGEFRIPLSAQQEMRDTVFEHVFAVPATIAIGAEFHNITSTDDAWRTRRMENAAYAFFAREDFRDYYKIAGYSGYVAFRPTRHQEIKVEWRSDNYESRDQQVFFGRWGGGKVLPPNPIVNEGRMNSVVLTFQEERARPVGSRSMNLFADSVSFEQLIGTSSVVQFELGHMPGADYGFNRYLIDTRNFVPLTHFLAFDSRVRFEATTGDLTQQKAEFIGGPGTLPGIYNKSIGGNRMILVNTEIRFNLAELSKVFGPDIQIVFNNDLGYVGLTSESSIVKGFEGLQFNTLAYNIGAALGFVSGIQIGASWRTDIKDTPRVVFRLERPF